MPITCLGYGCWQAQLAQGSESSASPIVMEIERGAHCHLWCRPHTPAMKLACPSSHYFLCWSCLLGSVKRSGDILLRTWEPRSRRGWYPASPAVSECLASFLPLFPAALECSTKFSSPDKQKILLAHRAKALGPS